MSARRYSTFSRIWKCRRFATTGRQACPTRRKIRLSSRLIRHNQSTVLQNEDSAFIKLFLLQIFRVDVALGIFILDFPPFSRSIDNLNARISRQSSDNFMRSRWPRPEIQPIYVYARIRRFSLYFFNFGAYKRRTFSKMLKVPVVPHYSIMQNSVNQAERRHYDRRYNNISF